MMDRRELLYRASMLLGGVITASAASGILAGCTTTPDGTGEVKTGFLTAEEMAKRYPGARLFWIMGADQWRALPAWKYPERLAGRVEFIVFSRDGEPAPHPGWRMHHLPGTHPASATAIRRDIAAGRNPTDWLPPEVAEFVRQKDLYNA